MDHDAITSQIRAALKMLRSTIGNCPEELWNRASDHNCTWALAYHGIYFAHLYLSPSEEAFEAFERSAAGRADRPRRLESTRPRGRFLDRRCSRLLRARR